MCRNSSYIVPFVGYSEDPCLLVFKYMPVCLSAVLDNRTFSSLASLVLVARDIARGMRNIHANNIVHFDLKPGKNTVTASNNGRKCFD